MPANPSERIYELELLHKDFKPYALEIIALISKYNLPFKVYETFRTNDRQSRLMNKGVSHSIHSKHLLGKAIDMVVYIDGKWHWENEYKHYYDFLGAVVEKSLGDKIKWGGRFTIKNRTSGQLEAFYDGAHFELREVSLG